MKKFYFVLLCLLLPISVSALEKETVTLSSCVDGDTAKFILNDEVITTRFLAIDTPETKHPTLGEEPYGKEASNFTCDKLSNASLIQIEYDSNSDKTDKYNRHLVWVFVDDYLLQDLIIKEGLAEVAYLYNDYKYTPILQDHEAMAKVSKVGLWSDVDTSIYTTSGGIAKDIDDSLITDEEVSSSVVEDEPNNNLLYGIIALGVVAFATSTGIISKSKGKKYAKKVRKKYDI